MSIFQNIKRLLKHSAVYGVGHIVSRSINFFLLPLYTNVLPGDFYGVVGLMFTYIAIVTIVYTYGLDAAFFRFYILEDSKQSRKCVFSTAFFTIFTTSIIFSGILFFAAESVAQAVFSDEVRQLSINLPYLIRLTSGILLFDSIAFLPFLILRAEERSGSFVVYKLFNVLINIGSNIIFLGVLKLGLEGIFLANVIASTTTFLILTRVIFTHVELVFSYSTLKKLFAFGIPYIPSNLAFVVMDTIDRPFLERLAGLEAAGLYNAGVKLGMFMSLFVAAFRFAWFPFFLSTSKQENAKATFSKVFTYVLLACFAVFLLLSFYIDHIVQFKIFGYSLIGKGYWQSTVVVPVIMLAYIFYAAYSNFLVGVYLKKKTKYLAYITLAGMFSNLIANYTLIPLLGIMGAAWARLIAYVIMSIALYIVARRLYFIRYEWLRVVKLGIVVVVIFLLGQNDFIQSNILLKAGLLITFPIVLLLTGFLDRAEIDKIRQLTSNVILAIGKSK